MKKLTLLGVTALSIITLSACSTSSSNSSGNSSKTTEASSSQKNDFTVGQAITFDKEAEITVTGVEFTDERNQFADSNPERVMQVTYNITNLSDKDYVIGSELSLYVNGKKMDTYPNDMTFETLSAGRSFEGAKVNFAVTESGNMELEVKPSFSFNSDKQIVKLDVQ